MELRVLNYFLAIAREENITKAAQILHITQPTLSRQIAQLEEELGVKLFSRGNHNIRLTEDGMLLKRRAQELLELSDKTKRELSHGKEHISGEIAIGCGETKSIIELTKIIVAFRSQYPDVTFDFYTGIADDIKDRIENGLIDIGLLLEPVDISKYHFIRMPREEKWNVLTRKDSPLASLQAVTPKDLVGLPIITAKRKSVQNELENWFGPYYEQLNIVATSNVSYSNRAMMVEHGLAVALVLEFDCGFANLCLRELSPTLSSHSVLVWKKNQTVSTAVSAFIAFAKKSLKSISNDSI